MLHILETLEIVQNYIVNTKSDFVIKNMKSGNSFEYRVEINTTSCKTNKNIYYIYTKHIESVYIGMIVFENVIINGETTIQKNFFISKRIQEMTDGIQKRGYIFQALFKLIYQDQKMPIGIEFYHTGLCAVCGRKLTNPKYMAIGIGPKCLIKKL